MGRCEGLHPKPGEHRHRIYNEAEQQQPPKVCPPDLLQLRLKKSSDLQGDELPAVQKKTRPSDQASGVPDL